MHPRGYVDRIKPDTTSLFMYCARVKVVVCRIIEYSVEEVENRENHCRNVRVLCGKPGYSIVQGSVPAFVNPRASRGIRL